MAGIRDVAKLAGVGVGTASRIINNTGSVSDAARLKVEKAMAELNYTPNALARSFYHKRSGIVAVLVPTVSHPFFAEFLDYVEKELYEHSLKTMICNTANEKNYELEYLNMLKSHMVDGMITGVHSLNVESYSEIDKPIVALDRYINSSIPVVAVDHWRGGQLAAETLVAAGCKEVVLFQESNLVESPTQARYKAFVDVLQRENVVLHPYSLEWNKFGIDYFDEITEEAFHNHPTVDAVYGTDLLALSYMKVAVRNGKVVPNDLKVVAYDGTLVTKVINYSIYVIKQPIEQLAKESVRLLVNKIEGKELQDNSIRLAVDLITPRTHKRKVSVR